MGGKEITIAAKKLMEIIFDILMDILMKTLWNNLLKERRII